MPASHLVDTAYLDIQLLLNRRVDYCVDLLGISWPDYQRQDQAKEGFTAGCFQLDWQKQQATCPLIYKK